VALRTQMTPSHSCLAAAGDGSDRFKEEVYIGDDEFAGTSLLDNA